MGKFSKGDSVGIESKIKVGFHRHLRHLRHAFAGRLMNQGFFQCVDDDANMTMMTQNRCDDDGEIFASSKKSLNKAKMTMMTQMTQKSLLNLKPI